MATDNSLIHDLPAVTVRRISVSEMSNNVYLLTAKKSGVQVLIDAADDAAAIRSMTTEAGADTPCSPGLHAVLTTHQHWDHVRALPELARPGVALAAGEPDAEHRQRRNGPPALATSASKAFVALRRNLGFRCAATILI